ncbi:MAG: hypothetical protein A4E24_01301 [Methanomethylovorans sp. PtaU1.Bin093]|uniref:hypothetical protein n=1 Tax=Methanomethylovorans sp. PtaU1.Bin093 TaxID=1811679 RepID=UPI0009CDF0DB|nr:hypothetical protein [Methanomethylovorans sp. PtaU1.Bin093]OPY20200.1 MAG: hypothetical protein A4E24_01301 [Methanomethylovorans sp. PtaU1.Bin093]
MTGGTKKELVGCSKADFGQIISNIYEFWGSDRTLHLHHTMLIYEFGHCPGIKAIMLFWIIMALGSIGLFL